MQRYAYYAGIPLLFLAMALTSEMPRVAALLFFIVALGFLANAGLGVYHSGVEWKFWPGPDTCGTVQALPTNATDLLKAAEQAVVVRCDEAAWRFAGPFVRRMERRGVDSSRSQARFVPVFSRFRRAPRRAIAQRLVFNSLQMRGEKLAA